MAWISFLTEVYRLCALKKTTTTTKTTSKNRLITLDMLWLSFFLSTLRSCCLLRLFFISRCLLLPFFLLHSIKNRWYDEEQIEEEIKEMTALGHLMNLCLPLKCTHALNPADRLRCRLFHNEMLILQAHTCIKPRAYSTYTRLYF